MWATHSERPFFVWDRNISWCFAYPRTVHVKEKSCPKITKLRQKGLLINWCHHCKFYDRRKTHGSLYSFFRFRNMLVCTSMWRIPQYWYSRHSRHNHVSRWHIRHQHLWTKGKRAQKVTCERRFSTMIRRDQANLYFSISSLFAEDSQRWRLLMTLISLFSSTGFLIEMIQIRFPAQLCYSFPLVQNLWRSL